MTIILYKEWEVNIIEEKNFVNSNVYNKFYSNDVLSIWLGNWCFCNKRVH